MTTSSPAPIEMPSICRPYIAAGAFWEPATEETCAASPGSPILLETVPAAFADLTCTAADGVLVPGDDDASRTNCAFIGKPMLESEYLDLVANVEAAGVRSPTLCCLFCDYRPVTRVRIHIHCGAGGNLR